MYLQQQDSIAAETAVEAVVDSAAPATASHPVTPYQVLRMLPRDATPEQQDSAIQAWFQPAQIRYSSRPDTLHLPGHEIPADPRQVNIPVYYREVFFAKELTVPEASPSKYGVAGDPVPYTVRGDDTMTLLLFFCFILFVLLLGRSRGFITRQLKNFFYQQHTEEQVSETSGEFHLQLFLVLQTCLLLAISTFSFATRYVSDTYVLDSDLQLIALYFGMFVGFFALRALLYTGVNLVLFDGKRNLQWMQTQLFLTSAEGVLLFPAVMVQVYFGISFETIAVFFTIVLLLTKLLTINKCWVIFFRQNVLSLQIILYFCALEIVPLLSFAGSLWMVTNMLKINF